MQQHAAQQERQQQVRTKLPPDRHSERRFLLPLSLSLSLSPPSLPLTEAARASILKQKKGEILITLAPNLSLSLSLSLYESKRVRNKIVERCHLSASFRALERAPRVFLLLSLPRHHVLDVLFSRNGSRAKFAKRTCEIPWVIRALCRPMWAVIFNLAEKERAGASWLRILLPIVCCKWSRTFWRMLATRR